MDSKCEKQYNKKKHSTLPPRRGQIKAKILEELAESIMSITINGGNQRKKNQFESHDQKRAAASAISLAS